MSRYDALAASYDGLMADGIYRRRADYLEKLFQKSAIPVRTVLDLACGTGTIACLLAAKGYDVTATDLSAEMPFRRGSSAGCTSGKRAEGLSTGGSTAPRSAAPSPSLRRRFDRRKLLS